MPSTSPLSTIACATLWLGTLLPLSAVETTLYSTDFSEFELGDDTLVGNNGWMSTHPLEGLHGTLDGIFEAGNRSGNIGFGIPAESEDDFNVVTLWRPIDVDPIADGTLIHFSVDTAIADSDNDFYDSFYYSIYNQDDTLLGSVIFDNTVENFGIWRYDGEDFDDLDIRFNHGQSYHLEMTIDFANNLWTATLDDLTLFQDSPFTSGDVIMNLGDVAAEWEIDDLDNPGTNWMYFDNWSVRASSTEEEPTEPDAIDDLQMVITSMGTAELSWSGNVGDRFLVEISDQLQSWNGDHPNAAVTATASGATFTDETNGSTARFYRVRRLTD